VRRAVEIVVLTGLQRPKEQQHAKRAQRDRGNGEHHERVHRYTLRVKRSAFSMTMSDDPDIATAAISGVTNPNAARGTAAAL